MVSVFKLFSRTSVQVIYLGASGGLGGVSDIVAVGLARLYGATLILHHHSFAYINRSSTSMNILFRIMRPSDVHVTLSSGMWDKLHARYGGSSSHIVLSNARLVQTSSTSIMRKSLRVVGFISNISEEKGIHEFVSILRIARRMGARISGKVAGPVLDGIVRDLILDAVAEGILTFLGPVYGADRELFYEGIDLLLFPSKYKNEAEPLVVLEALQSGLPVIASRRGCMPDLLRSTGLVFDLSAAGETEAASQILDWSQSDESYQSASVAARSAWDERYRESQGGWSQLLSKATAWATPLAKLDVSEV